MSHPWPLPPYRVEDYEYLRRLARSQFLSRSEFSHGLNACYRSR